VRSNFPVATVIYTVCFRVIGADTSAHFELGYGTKLLRVTWDAHLFSTENTHCTIMKDEGLQDSALNKPFSHIGYFWKPKSREIRIKSAVRSPVRSKYRKRNITKSLRPTDGSIKPPSRRFHIKRQSMLGLRQKCAYPNCAIQGSYGVLDNISTQTGLSSNSSNVCSRKLFCKYVAHPTM
jgi:hypothetical protein